MTFNTFGTYIDNLQNTGYEYTYIYISECLYACLCGCQSGDRSKEKSKGSDFLQSYLHGLCFNMGYTRFSSEVIYMSKVDKCQYLIDVRN